jgi:hypothetical protein
VKKLIRMATMSLLLCSQTSAQADSILEADLDEASFSAEQLPKAEDGNNPFKISFAGNVVGAAKFDKSGYKHHSLRYREAEANLRFVFWYNPEYKEGAYTTIGYNIVELKWCQNPYFKQSQFNTVGFTLGAFSQRLCNWLWLAYANFNLDADRPNFNEYANYDLVIWGRYDYAEGIGLNVGFIGETGMKIDRVYPIIGVDWQATDKWLLSMVFPINISLTYQWDACLAYSLAIRTFDSRHRVGQHATVPRALVAYRNVGAEFGIEYEYASLITMNLHAGYTFGGTLKVANRHYEHKRRFDFDPAAYFGGEVGIRF